MKRVVKKVGKARSKFFDSEQMSKSVKRDLVISNKRLSDKPLLLGLILLNIKHLPLDMTIKNSSNLL